METEAESFFDTATTQLDKIAAQLQKGSINKNDFETQRLIILIDLVINYKKVMEK
jgi:hypothetical protein